MNTRHVIKFQPKYITFDCYGTLTNFDMAGAARLRRASLPGGDGQLRRGF
jgi:FMN phosphatase YigB (HAD superfamily)